MTTEFREQIEAHEAATRRDPTDARAFHNLGVALYQAGDFDEATRALERALALAPGSADSLYTLGLVHKDLGRHAEACELLRRALALEPGHARAAYNLGTCLFAAGDPCGAVSAFERVCELTPLWLDATYNLVVALAAAREYDRAEAVLAQNEDLGRLRADLYCCLGCAYAEDAQIGDDQAEECLQKALALEPDHVEARYRLGLLHARAKYRDPARRAAAVAELERLAARDDLDLEFPDAFRIHFALASCFDDDEGDLDRAVEAYRRCLAEAPSYAPALNNLGVVLKRQGDTRGALEMFRRAVLADPEYAHAYHNLCGCYYDSSPRETAEDVAELLRASEADASCHRVLQQLIPTLVDLAKADAFAAMYDQMHAIKNLVGVGCSRLRSALRRADEGGDGSRELSEAQELQNQAYDGLVEFLRVLRPPEAEPEIVNLNEVIRRAVLHVQALGPEFADVRFEPAATLPSIKGEPRRLREMIVNLLLNAGQAIEAGGGRGEIRVAVEVAAPRLLGAGYSHIARIIVADTGPGMTEEARRNASRPGYTTRQGGSGFGLPIATQIAKEHRGILTIESTPGVGTTVTVELPPSIELHPRGARMRLRPVIFEDFREMMQTEVDHEAASDTHGPELR